MGYCGGGPRPDLATRLGFRFANQMGFLIWGRCYLLWIVGRLLTVAHAAVHDRDVDGGLDDLGIRLALLRPCAAVDYRNCCPTA
ncbi:hypothetical protein ACLOJK_034831 [Asimina triloba]